jgi:hypothetical protein
MTRTMPRPRTGSIRRKQTTLGTTYGLRFKYRGEEHYHHLGGSWEGWTDERAEEERRYVMAQVERGEYVPQRRDAAPPIGVGDVPTFQILASLVLDRVRRRVASSSADDLEWRLRTAMDHFGFPSIRSTLRRSMTSSMRSCASERRSLRPRLPDNL